MNQDDVIERRRELLMAKTRFATIIFNLKEKGTKLTDTGKFMNQLIRERNVNVLMADDVDYIKNHLQHRTKHLDKNRFHVGSL